MYGGTVANGRRRVLAAITPEDEAQGHRTGPAKVFGYGPGYLMMLGDLKTRKAVLATIARGVPLDRSLPVAIAWGLARRGKAETASLVLRDYGLSHRYVVRRRTLIPIGPQ